MQVPNPKDVTLSHGRKCVKPFKLATTSFIYPDHIVPNVKKLGGFFDEIEILAFESQPESVLPSRDDVKILLELSQRLNLTYNIHLPTDISLTCDSSEKSQKAADTFLKVIDLFESLKPTTYTLHLDMPMEIKNDIKKQTVVKTWEENTHQGLARLISGISDPRIISIETLDYPFSLIDDLVEEFNLSVCIDVGHQIKYGYNLSETFEKYKQRTSIMHLHGVEFTRQKIKDHTSLDLLPEKYIKQILKPLEAFTGVVSLEVFNRENLNRSLSFLSRYFNDIMPHIEKLET